MAYTTINKSTDHFNTKLYTGNGSTNAITGVGFQPDFTWIKQRSATRSHMLFDAIRGATYRLSSDTNEANGQYSTSLTAFNTDGFTLGAFNDVNASSGTFASWNWLANGQGSANTDGTINTTYTSANTTSGFSIIKYNGNGSAGATIGHGLGVAPKCVIIKRTDTTSNWIFGTGATGFTKFLYLNTTDTEQTNSGTFNDTAPSSSLITLGSWNDVNNSSGTYICYAFAEKTGYSKFGLYEGNGNSNGAFIYTGFKPAFVLLKGKGNTESWTLYDNKINPYNEVDTILFANLSQAEQSGGDMDFLSNGFKLRGTDGRSNASGQGYIYMAFGQSLVGSNNIPATAR